MFCIFTVLGEIRTISRTVLILVRMSTSLVGFAALEVQTNMTGRLT
jgi:hypothetical protein